MNTIPDDLSADIKDYFLGNPPTGFETWEPNRWRLKHETDEPPVPRVEILPGIPQRIGGMDGTCKLPFTLKLVTQSIASDQSAHDELKAALGAAWRGLRSLRKASNPFSRTYMHDLLYSPPEPDTHIPEHDERVATFRGTFIVSELLMI